MLGDADANGKTLSVWEQVVSPSWLTDSADTRQPSAEAGAELTVVGLAVDVVAFTIAAGQLQVLLVERTQSPHAQSWALPGSMVRVGEELSQAARRALQQETGLAAGHLEQLYTFGALGRDPRGRVISVAHMVLVPEGHEAQRARTHWHAAHALPPLAFDHADIIALALKRLQRRLHYAGLAFEFLPELFTLPELQGIHEAVLNTPLDKRNFRKRVLAQGQLIPSGERRQGVGRPAGLYKCKKSAL